MIKGMYKAASAMIPRIRQQETIANNLANASAPGFKKDMVFTQELSKAQARRVERKNDWETPMIDQVYTNYDQGSLDRTNNPLDMAIEGIGFFVVQDPETEDLYLTRGGNFSISPDGYLSTPDGMRVMSDAGPITLEGGDVTVSETGQIAVNETPVANIRVTEPDDINRLTKVGKNAFNIPDGVELRAAVDFAVRQGYLESSNIDAVREMVDMIISFRGYESDAQALKIQDGTLEKLINNVGRVR
jgi:flagellar basal-body rod protein FlgG